MSVSSVIHQKTASEVRNASVSFDAVLDVGELLTGTPTVVEVTTTALTLTNKAINTAIVPINYKPVAIGKAVQFSVSGGVVGTTYDIKISCSTTATPAQTLYGTIKLQIVADTE